MYILRKNNYLYTYMIFLNELNNQSYSNFILNDFNILDVINQVNQNENFINLIMNSNLNKRLSSVNFMNLDIRIIIDFNCTRHFFIDRSIFIIYIKIQFRFIKDIKDVKVQSFVYDIINFNCNINNKRVILTILNVLHIFDINVNFLSIEKFLNVDIEIVFYKKDYVLI